MSLFEEVEVPEPAWEGYVFQFLWFWVSYVEEKRGTIRTAQRTRFHLGTDSAVESIVNWSKKREKFHASRRG